MKTIYKHKGYYNGIDAVMNCDLTQKQSLTTLIMASETSSLAKTMRLMMSSIFWHTEDVLTETSSLLILSAKIASTLHSTY